MADNIREQYMTKTWSIKDFTADKHKVITFLAIFLIVVLFLRTAVSENADQVIIYPTPTGETLSTDYKVSIGNQDVPVYSARVAPADAERRWKAMDDKKNSADFFDTAAFAYFDMQDTVNVTVTVPDTVTNAKILPSSAGIVPHISGKSISFKVMNPGHLTVEINGEWVKSLHIFANPLETNIPRPDDPNVIYFGPGIHEVSHMVIGDNKTVYVAGGAVVRAIIRPDEKFNISGYSGLRTYSPTFELRGTNITFRGRGIIDANGCTTHARHMIFVKGSDIRLEGVILRDSSTWTIPVRQSDRVNINNVKLIGYRANSDGVDICNSRDVTVENCFIRTLDDLIVVKSDKGQGEVKRIVARNCVLWNQVAHALSVGAEIRDDVSDILFTNCDILHDQGREWSLRIFHCDAARISNVRFENIRIEEARKCISVWIGKAVWTRDEERGNIQGIVFKNIQASGNPLKVELVGIDTEHSVEDILFQDVTLNGRPITSDMIQTNAFVKNLVIKP